MARNVELFRRVADQIERHPETYDQCEWCGTAQCVAAWAAELDGCRSTEPRNQGLVTRGGVVCTVEQAARMGLGITVDEADVADGLFAADWSPARSGLPGLSVPEALRAFADGAPIIPEEVP